MFEDTSVTRKELKILIKNADFFKSDVVLATPVKNTFKVADQDIMKWVGIPVISKEYGDGEIEDMPQSLKGGIMIVNFSGKKVSMACPESFHPHATTRPDLKEAILHPICIDTSRLAPHGEDLDDLSEKMKYLAYLAVQDKDEKRLMKKAENGLLSDDMLAVAKWQIGLPAKTFENVSLADLFEIAGFISADGVMNFFAIQVPSRSVAAFEKEFPNEKYSELHNDGTWGKSFRIQFDENIEDFPTCIAPIVDNSNMINNNAIGRGLLGLGCIHAGVDIDVDQVRECAKANGCLNEFEAGLSFGEAAVKKDKTR